MPVQTAREYLFSVGLTKAPTGRGRFSREGIAALSAARAKGVTFADDEVKPAKPTKVVKSAPVTEVAVKSERPNVDPKAVRAWAVENGHDVGERGRIHSSIIDEYVAAMGENAVERGNEMDVYRDSMARTYPEGTKFKGTLTYKGIEETFVVGTRSACMNCRVSLVICTCGAPVVSSGYAGPVRVYPVA